MTKLTFEYANVNKPFEHDFDFYDSDDIKDRVVLLSEVA